MSGFADLRLNRQHGQVNESFWPSFTDIMTVVTMIFLIAMVVLLMRNIELVNELRETMAAERLAAEQAARTGAANESLALELRRTQARIEELQLQLAANRAAAEDQRLRDRALIDEQRGEIATLVTERNDLTEQLALAHLAVDQQRQQMDGLQQQLSGVQTRLDNTLKQRDDLDLQLGQVRKDLLAAERARQSSEQQYGELAGRFDELQLKYNKLIRPARSPNGRYLVEVRYRKVQGKPRLSFREAGKGTYQTLSQKQLDARLSGLKKAHEEGLYVKIIIPDDSGLSYTEAWVFTRDTLAKYDYYYEEQPPGASSAQ